MYVLASDFDNTLFFRNIEGGFKNEDFQAIHDFQSDGHLFGLCSGRPIAGLLHPLKNQIKPDFFIVSTGGLILDRDYHVLYAKSLSFEIACQIYETYQDEIELLVQTSSLDNVYMTNPLPDDQNVVAISSMEDMKGKEIYSFSLIKSTQERAKQITKQINEQYHEVDAYQNVDSIDIVCHGCSKGAAILKLKDFLGIDCIAGIGDSYNDLPMLNVVNTAFTFDYSPDEVKNQSDYVVSNIKEAIQTLKEE